MENTNNTNTGMTFGEEMDKASFDVVDPGDYEVVLKAERRYTRDGNKCYLNCDFKIRDDINQPFAGRHVFDKIWTDKSNPLWFDLKKLNKIIKTQANPKVNFGDVDECIQYINGLKMKVTIDKEFSDYSGEDENTIKYLSYRMSDIGSATPKTETAPKPGTALGDDDLPF